MPYIDINLSAEKGLNNMKRVHPYIYTHHTFNQHPEWFKTKPFPERAQFLEWFGLLVAGNMPCLRRDQTPHGALLIQVTARRIQHLGNTSEDMTIGHSCRH